MTGRRPSRDRREPHGTVPTGTGQGTIEIGGTVRRVAILTIRFEPCACYLARRLRSSGAHVYLVSQRRLKVEPHSAKYFRRLFRRWGPWICLDYLLLHLLKTAVRAPGRAWQAISERRPSSAGQEVSRSSPAVSGSTAVTASLKDDPDLTREERVTVIEVDDINNGPDLETLRSLEPDLVLLAGAPLLTRRVLEIPKIACINPHCGVTPDYAGAAPFDWAVYEKRFQDIGYTIHLVVPKVDSGPVLHQERIEWDPSRPNGHLWPVLAQRMYDKLAETTLALIAGQSFTAIPQGATRVMPPAGLFARSLAELRRIRYASALKRSRG